MIKQSIKKAQDTDLMTGLAFERQSFCLLSGTKDRNEGLLAFKEKRKPHYIGQ
jgi:enoyl-CoA hydratase